MRKMLLLGLLTVFMGCNTGRNNVESAVSEDIVGHDENVGVVPEEEELEEDEINEGYSVLMEEDFVSVSYSIQNQLQFIYNHLLPNNRYFNELSAVIMVPWIVNGISVLQFYISHNRSLSAIREMVLVNQVTHQREYDCINPDGSQTERICREMQERVDEFYRIYFNDIFRQLRDNIP